jgi:hypothetical protein
MTQDLPIMRTYKIAVETTLKEHVFEKKVKQYKEVLGSNIFIVGMIHTEDKREGTLVSVLIISRDEEAIKAFSKITADIILKEDPEAVLADGGFLV